MNLTIMKKRVFLFFFNKKMKLMVDTMFGVEVEREMNTSVMPYTGSPFIIKEKERIIIILKAKNKYKIGEMR